MQQESLQGDANSPSLSSLKGYTGIRRGYVLVSFNLVAAIRILRKVSDEIRATVTDAVDAIRWDLSVTILAWDLAIHRI
jgi:hypothetical protein